MKYQEALEKLQDEKGDPSKYDEETLFITEPCVCVSPAGFYVGTWCIEVMQGHWFPQPYSRDTGYMSEEDAVKKLGANDEAAN